jgi:hypothetical protein
MGCEVTFTTELNIGGKVEKEIEIANHQLTEEISEEISQEILDTIFYLPVGTLVKLKGDEAIYSVLILADADLDAVEIDGRTEYVGVTYYSHDEWKMEIFNHREIEKVIFLGYLGEESCQFLEDIYVERAGARNEELFSKIRSFKQAELTKEQSDLIWEKYEYLPIGTVIRIKGEEELFITVMIGILERKTQIFYDYILNNQIGGDIENSIHINHRELSGEIIYLGYVDEFFNLQLIPALREKNGDK